MDRGDDLLWIEDCWERQVAESIIAAWLLILLDLGSKCEALMFEHCMFIPPCLARKRPTNKTQM